MCVGWKENNIAGQLGDNNRALQSSLFGRQAVGPTKPEQMASGAVNPYAKSVAASRKSILGF